MKTEGAFLRAQAFLRRKEGAAVCVTQALFLGLLFLLRAEPYVFIVMGVISLLCITQGLLGSADRRAKRAVPRNLLFPTFLYRHRLPVALVLLCFSSAPFLFCMSTGEGITPINDTTATHINSISIISNTMGWITELCVLTMLARSPLLRDFVSRGYDYQNLVRTISLDVSLLISASFIRNLETPFAVIDQHTFTHNRINMIFLLILCYIMQASAYNVVAFVYRMGAAGRVKLFTRRDMIFLEPCLLVYFFLGAFTPMDGISYRTFLVFCPTLIFIFATLIGLFGVDAETADTVHKRAPVKLATLVMFGNLLIFAGIVAVRQSTPFIMVPFAGIILCFLLSILIGSLGRWSALRRDEAAIARLCAQPHSETSFDERVRAYHKMRAVK